MMIGDEEHLLCRHIKWQVQGFARMEIVNKMHMAPEKYVSGVFYVRDREAQVYDG